MDARHLKNSFALSAGHGPRLPFHVFYCKIRSDRMPISRAKNWAITPRQKITNPNQVCGGIPHFGSSSLPPMESRLLEQTGKRLDRTDGRSDLIDRLSDQSVSLSDQMGGLTGPCVFQFFCSGIIL
jgi:hypothetical protein